jgi:transposase
METIPTNEESSTATTTERLAYSIQEAADLLGVHYFSIYRLIQRGKLKTCGRSGANCTCPAPNC